MLKETNARYNIHERIYQFVLQVIIYVKKLPASSLNQVLVGQIVRSVTSIGANDQEANGASMKADFIHCYTLVRKEARETVYWLRLIGDLHRTSTVEVGSLIIEGEEIVRIVSTIMYNTRKKITQ